MLHGMSALDLHYFIVDGCRETLFVAFEWRHRVTTDCRTRCHVNPDQRPYAGAESPVCRIPCRRRHNRDSATQAASAPVTVVGISVSQKKEPSKFPYLPLERLNVTLKTCQKL